MRPIFPQRSLQIDDGLTLHRPQPLAVQGRQIEQVSPQLCIEPGQPNQFLGTVESEHLAAARVGIEAVGELRHHAGGLIGKRC